MDILSRIPAEVLACIQMDKGADLSLTNGRLG